MYAYNTHTHRLAVGRGRDTYSYLIGCVMITTLYPVMYVLVSATCQPVTCGICVCEWDDDQFSL